MLNGLFLKNNSNNGDKPQLGAQANSKINKNNLAANTPKNDADYAKKIVLASKGEAGYNIHMDLDKDGIITLAEFNEYCEENSVDEQAKQRLLEVMQMAKLSSDINEKTIKKQEKEVQETQKEPEIDSDSIYARRGDDKYDERMDENKDSKVTYKEYMDYCEKRALANEDNKKEDGKKENSNQTFDKKRAQAAYSSSKGNEEPPEIKIEAEA